MAAILLTGVTGNVGSSLASFLKNGGHKLVYLVRPRDGQTAKQRLDEALAFNLDANAIEGDVRYYGLRVFSDELWNLRGKIDKIVHCASSIKFDEKKSGEIRVVNVCGTANVLDFAREMEIPEVHYVSTAYVAGSAESFAESDMYCGQVHRNVYERTKLEAEALVKNWSYGKHSIYRLGIVVGNTATGYTPSFSGYYGFLSAHWRLRQTFASMRQEELEKYKADGIGFDQNGIFQLPIVVNFSPTSTLNIVPADWVAKSLADLIDLPANGKTFHVVHPNPPKIRWLHDVSLRHLGVAGFCYGISSGKYPRSLLGKFQRIFDRGTAQYLPYTTHEAKFEICNMPLALGQKYVAPPDVDEPFIAKLMDYAKSVNFGKA